MQFVSSAFKRFDTVLGPYVADADQSFGGYTLAAKIRPVLFKATGSIVRLTLHGLITSGNAATLNNVTIGLASRTTGAGPADTSAAPTAITFSGGSASVVLGQGPNGFFRMSDEITFQIDGSRAIIIAFNVAAGGYAGLRSALNVNRYTMYSRAATAEAGTQTKTAGYTATGGILPFVHKLECLS